MSDMTDKARLYTDIRIEVGERGYKITGQHEGRNRFYYFATMAEMQYWIENRIQRPPEREEMT